LFLGFVLSQHFLAFYRGAMGLPAIAAIIGRQALIAKGVAGLALGAAGVAMLVGFDLEISSKNNVLAVGAALTASLFYGLASNYAASAPAVESYNNAHGSMWALLLYCCPHQLCPLQAFCFVLPPLV